MTADESGNLVLYMYLTLSSAKVGTGIFLRFPNDFQKSVPIHASPFDESLSCFCFLEFLTKKTDDLLTQYFTMGWSRYQEKSKRKICCVIKLAANLLGDS